MHEKNKRRDDHIYPHAFVMNRNTTCDVEITPAPLIKWEQQ
jgi:hypothetical protein